MPAATLGQPNLSAAAAAPATATVTIDVPKAAADRPRWVSSGTKSIGIVVKSGTKIVLRYDANLIAGSKGCTALSWATSCKIVLSLPSTGNFTGSFTTYSGLLNKGIPTGSVLSANQNVPMAIRTGNNPIDLTLDAVPAGVRILPAIDGSLTGNQTKGFTISKCAKPTAIVAIAVDAGGRYIIGSGAPAMALTSSDTAHLAVSAPSAQEPNTYTLTVPAIPNAKAVVALTATATPLAGSGGKPVVQKAGVSFNGDICGVFSEYPLRTPLADPFGITAGPDGALWFVEESASRVGRITTGGSITEYPTKTAHAGPITIATGADGALWFAEVYASKIGRITTKGVLTEYTPKTAHADPLVIVEGPDKRMWFSENGGSAIAAITTAGTISEYPITSGAEPAGVAVGPDNALWFLEANGSKIGRMTIAGALSFEMPIPNALNVQTMARDAAGNFWVTDLSGKQVFDINSSTVLATSLSLPNSKSAPEFVIEGPDGAIWVGDTGGNELDRISGSPQTIARYPVPTAGGLPQGLCVGPDGAIWFSEAGGNKIGRLQ